MNWETMIEYQKEWRISTVEMHYNELTSEKIRMHVNITMKSNKSRIEKIRYRKSLRVKKTARNYF